jgi:hypothetical protein
MSTVSLDNTSSFLMFRLDTDRNLLLSDITFSFHVTLDTTDPNEENASLILQALHNTYNSSITVQLVLSQNSTILMVQTVQYGSTLHQYNISLPGT